MMIYNSGDELIGNHEIGDSDTLSFTLDGDMFPLPPFWFANQEPEIGDSIYLNFNNERYLTYGKNHNNIFLQEYYRQVEVSKRNFVHYWEFTVEDYENATVIEP
jgi:hypothetical protein